MATFGFIVWCIAIVVSICFLFRSPKFISSRVMGYLFPGYGRELKEQDHKFIQAHTQIIDEYRGKPQPPRSFILSGSGYLALFILSSAIVMAILSFGGPYVVWLADMTGNRVVEFSFLVFPFGGTFTLLVGMFLNSGIIVPALQFWAAKKDKIQVASFLFSPSSYGSADQPEQLTKRTSDYLEILLREGSIDRNKKYTIGDLTKICVYEQTKQNRRLVTASCTLFFSMFLMDALEFVKISNNEIIYSPAYSFAIKMVHVDDVVSVKYICEKKRNDRILKMLVELNSGYSFKVRRHEIKNMSPILTALENPLEDIDEAHAECERSR